MGLEITERYKGALEEIFANKKGYIYTLNGRGFLEEQKGQTEMIDYCIKKHPKLKDK